jgi:hypothetical protein
MIAPNFFRSTLRLTLRMSAVLSIASTAAWAQVGAPVLGLLPDRGVIHPVNGIPASASIAPALDFGAEFLQIAISARQSYALVSTVDTGAVLLAYPNGTTTPVAGLSAYPDAVVLSPLGSAALLWFASPRLLEIVSGLPGSPVVRQVNATFLSGDVPAALAVSDDGAWGVGAWSSGVWGFGPNGDVRNLLSGDRASALAFFAGREDLAAATRNGIYSVSDVGGSAAISTLYTGQNSPSGLAPLPSGLGISTDNRRLLTTDRAGDILTLDLVSSTVTELDCGCAPEGVFSMGGSLFRITGLTGSVFRVFDAAAGAVFMVPLAPDSGPPAPSQPVGRLTGEKR